MKTGVVKWYDSGKKYGFILEDGSGKDVFVHSQTLERAGILNLEKGEKVSYEIAVDKGRESAVNLKKSGN